MGGIGIWRKNKEETRRMMRRQGGTGADLSFSRILKFEWMHVVSRGKFYIYIYVEDQTATTIEIYNRINDKSRKEHFSLNFLLTAAGDRRTVNMDNSCSISLTNEYLVDYVSMCSVLSRRNKKKGPISRFPSVSKKSNSGGFFNLHSLVIGLILCHCREKPWKLRGRQ